MEVGPLSDAGVGPQLISGLSSGLSFEPEMRIFILTSPCQSLVGESLGQQAAGNDCT